MHTTVVPAAAEGSVRPLSFPCPEPPPPGRVAEVAPGVYWLRMPLPFALNHINLWLLRDGERWTAVDCGIGLEETRSLWEKVFAEVTGSSGLDRIIVTHFHPDHFGNAGWLSRRFAAALWMSEAEFLTAHAQYHGLPGFTVEATAALFAAHGLDEARVSAIAGRGNAYRRSVAEPPAHFVRLLDGDELLIGDQAWRVIAGYGHAPEHAALYCAALGVLISGDMLLPKISTNVSVWPLKPEDDPLKLFLASIERFRELPADTLVLPSHGLPFRGAHERVRMLQEHHRERLAEVHAACASPRCAAELLPVLFRRALDNHQTFFAMGESIAHLNYLWLRGELARTRGIDGVYRFGIPA